MGARRRARELALQMLYSYDVCGMKPEETGKTLLKPFKIKSEIQDFALEIVNNTIENLAEIDALISRYAKNWQLKRITSVDRCIIRLASSEIMCMKETPINVIIDEAIELAKKYSTEDSGKFVNGLLDRIKEARK